MITEAEIHRYDAKWKLTNKAARGCYLSKLFYVSEGRSFFSRDRPESCVDVSAFYQTLDSAKAYAELLQGPKSDHCIEEVPALVFRITSWCLVVTEIHTAFPFESFIENIPDSQTISDIAVFFSPRRYNTLQRFFSIYRELERPLSFRSLDSPPANDKMRRWHQHAQTHRPVLEIKYAEALTNRLQCWIDPENPQ